MWKTDHFGEHWHNDGPKKFGAHEIVYDEVTNCVHAMIQEVGLRYSTKNRKVCAAFAEASKKDDTHTHTHTHNTQQQTTFDHGYSTAISGVELALTSFRVRSTLITFHHLSQTADNTFWTQHRVFVVAN